MLQEPLEEGDTLKLSAPLQCIVSGLGLTVRLTLFTIAQQRVQKLAHPPLPLPQSLDHCWQLKGQSYLSLILIK